MLKRTGGAQRVMNNLVGYFHSQGYEVVLVNDFPVEDPTYRYDVPEGIKRYYLRDRLAGNPVIKNLRRILALRKILKQEKPELALSFLWGPNLRLLTAAAGLNCKTVISVRNDPKRECGNSRFRQWFANWMFQKADGCVFQTPDAMEYFRPCIRERSKVIMNPVSAGFYQLERSKDPHGIVTFCRLAPQKNLTMLIDAFAMIAEQFPDEELEIYGNGPLRDELEEYGKATGLSGRIKIHGNTPEVGRRLSEAKLFVLSSDYEGMPNAMMEAMASGTPVVATDCPCGGPRMLLNHKDQGILVPCGETEQLAQAMRSVLEDPALQQRMSEKAKNRALDFHETVVCRQWEQYCRDVACRQRNRS